MYELFGSENKTKIVSYLANNPDKSINEIAKNTQINYKNAYKILQELIEKSIVEKNNEYQLNPRFIEFVKSISDSMVNNYSQSIYLKNKLDLYNTLISIYPDDNLNKITNEIDNWLMEKLDNCYCKFYDFENKEYEKIKELINNHYSTNNWNILEIGCGTGRITKKLSNDYQKVTGIDTEEKFINFCKNHNTKNNLTYQTPSIENYESKEKFDVVICSWIGLHYNKEIEKIINNIKKISKNNALLIITDAYYNTQYVDILQMIRYEDMSGVKLLKEKLNEQLIENFENFNQEVLFTQYQFNTIDEVINNFKIELTLEESHIWTKHDEETLKNYLINKQDPTTIQEGLWVTRAEINSTK